MSDWTRDRLLSRQRRLEGPRPVATRVRPTRIAYLIDPVSIDIALAAISGACLEWGGQFNFLIPCAPGGRPDESWTKILHKFDPDLMLDLVGADAEFTSEQSAQYGRYTRLWQDPLNIWLPGRASVFSSLDRWKAHRPEGANHKLTYFRNLSSHASGLPIAFEYGNLNGSRIAPKFQLVRSWPDSVNHGDFVSTHVLDVADLTNDEIIDLVSSSSGGAPFRLERLESGLTHQYTLVDLTTIGIPTREPSYSNYMDSSPPPEYPQDNEAYFRHVIVLGNPDSISDLCLAWNLRAQRFPSTKLPVWLSPDWLDREDVRRNVGFSLNITHPGLHPQRDGSPNLHFLSMSLSLQSMKKSLMTFPHQHTIHDATSIEKFFTDSFETGRTEGTIAYFQNGFSHVNLPDHRDMASFRRFDDLEWSVKIDGYKPPIPPQRHYHLTGGTFRSFRLSSEGITGGLGSHESTRTLVSLGAYVGFEVVEGLAESVGYEAEISDKGQLAFPVLQLLGGSTGLSVVASSLVFALLRRMSLVNKRQSIQSTLATILGHSPTVQEIDDAERTVQETVARDVSPDRQVFRWSQLKESLAPAADPTARAIVKWLVDHQIIFRGVELKCANCNLRSWYVIDRLSALLTCDGCRVESPIPVDVQGEQWSYRLNELIARAIDQGVLAQLLAARRFLEGREDTLGYLPGVTLTPRQGSGHAAVEIDVLAILAGRVVIGECKTSSHLSDQELTRMGTLARLFECSRVLITSTSRFENRDELTKRLKELCAPAMIVVWEQDQLFDVELYPNFLQKSPKAYLESLPWRLSR